MGICHAEDDEEVEVVEEKKMTLRHPFRSSYLRCYMLVTYDVEEET